MSSRLRLLAGYMFEAIDFYKVPYVVMIWPLNKDCNSHFLDIFQPVKNLYFISPDQRKFYTQHANITFEMTWYSFERILFMHKITEYTIPLRRKIYKMFIPVDKIYNEVVRFVVLNNICNMSAIHVRRTDMELTHRRRSVTTDEELFEFIESTPKEEKVFLMADNKASRELFIKKYPAKLLVYSNFESDEKSISIGGRHTPLSYAITEMFIAAHAYNFHGTVGSSFSELIAVYSDIYTSTRQCLKLSAKKIVE